MKNENENGKAKVIVMDDGETLTLEEIISVALGDYTTKIIEYACRNYNEDIVDAIKECVDAAFNCIE